MQKYLLASVRIVGIILVAHALMLIGADEISTLEAGGVRMIRSLGTILTLYGADPISWAAKPAQPLAGIVRRCCHGQAGACWRSSARVGGGCSPSRLIAKGPVARGCDARLARYDPGLLR
jgi:hypothetical protein